MPALRDAINNLRAAGIAPIIATGNNYATDEISVPACISSAVSVAATEDDDDPANFFQACNMLEAGAGGFSIDGAGVHVELRAGNGILLEGDFAVQNGASLTLVLGPPV